MTDDTDLPGVDPGSGDRAVAAAAERAKETAPRNIPVFDDLPLPSDTANLREGANLHDGLLELVEGLSEADWIGRCKFSCDGALLYEIAQDWVKNERAKIELEKIRP